jgi:hypothetical protein
METLSRYLERKGSHEGDTRTVTLIISLALNRSTMPFAYSLTIKTYLVDTKFVPLGTFSSTYVLFAYREAISS